MPLTEFQRILFSLLKANRSPDSHIMGATVLNASDHSVRYSRDIDIGHDIATSVATSSELDSNVLRDNGYEVTFSIQQPTFQRAVVSKGGNSILIEWVYDSAFRFFPLEPDRELGYRLHFFDAATNKILALAGRSEPRDFVDVLELNRNVLSIGALTWAAAGKDEGLNPHLILELAERFARYRQADLDALDCARPLNIESLSEEWRNAVASARKLVDQLPTEDLGCLYLDNDGAVCEPDPSDDKSFTELRRHFGSVGGAWPRLVGE